MGRRQPTLAGRHPEESAAALLQRQGSMQFGFDPRAGQVRAGIRGQAFGVGALEVEDEDVYTNDQLADYDWEIGGAASEDNEDDEEAEMEAARLGRWSKSSGARKSNVTPKVVRQKTFDGWTAPSNKSAVYTSTAIGGTVFDHRCFVRGLAVHSLRPFTLVYLSRCGQLNSSILRPKCHKFSPFRFSIANMGAALINSSLISSCSDLDCCMEPFESFSESL
ncbi:hypothetical protein X801_08912 [Opisthorchis viverrini]|uniref:Uncharacterized protein n=1 Tax=Opisthorchis viverrini TaxID=6198 RepID=A0A1S8WLF6_OPIVI|nr:hypothetical protein X801_08912 [Opisthorchis viverrini]